MEKIFKSINNWLKSSLNIRLFTLGFLTFILLAPLDMVHGLIREREHRKSQAINEVSNKWGKKQLIQGITLSIPIITKARYFNKDKKDYDYYSFVDYIHYLPEKLNINGSLIPKVLHRGIFEIVVYNADLNINGSFNLPKVFFNNNNVLSEKLKSGNYELISTKNDYNNAFVSLGISDLSSIQKKVKLKWQNQEIEFDAGIKSNDLINSGISANVSFDKDQEESILQKKEIPFSLKLNLNGSDKISFAPLGKETNVELKSPWDNPSFDGVFLPDSRNISDQGFEAKWNILSLNRNYPQVIANKSHTINSSTFGVNLLLPVNEYQKSMRSVKYGILFITLTFISFFFLELFFAKKVHPIQYILVGLALSIFYLLLISLSEHLNFEKAYLLSSISVIIMICAYVKSIFKKNLITGIMFAQLSALYSFIYVTLSLKDYSLLMGSLGLFVILAVLMYLTQKIEFKKIVHHKV